MLFRVEIRLQILFWPPRGARPPPPARARRGARARAEVGDGRSEFSLKIHILISRI